MHRDGPGISGVDVEPQALALGDRRRSAATGSTDGGRRRADRGDDRDGQAPGGSVRGDRRSERLRIAARTRRRRDPDECPPGRSQRHARLLDRAVGLGRGVDAERPARPARPASPRRATSSPAASRAAARAMSVDVDAVSVSRPSKAVRQPERLAQPVDDDLLELGADRRRPPEHRVLAERRRSASRRGSRARTRSSRSTPRSPDAASAWRSARSGARSRRGSRRVPPGSSGAAPGTRGGAIRARSPGRPPASRPSEVVGHQVDDGVGGRAKVAVSMSESPSTCAGSGTPVIAFVRWTRRLRTGSS